MNLQQKDARCSEIDQPLEECVKVVCLGSPAVGDSSEVHCTFRSLRRVPPGLPALTRRINLGFNSIQRLHNSSLLGLKSVELLMLHSNELQELPPGAFRDMERLQCI
uniref:Uncharacterized protein n=1 Tax=Knipowitschia caucasica TaxID=637954 RepID=A0AAV2K0I7_KNICA